MQRNILIVMDGNWFYNSIVLGQNPYDIDSIRRALGRDWEQTHRIDYRRLVNEIEGHTTRFQPSARTFRSVAFFCSPPNVPMPANRLRMLEDMTASGFEIYHVPSNPVAVATELVSSISTYDIACVISGDRSIAYTMGHIKAKGKLVELVTLRGAFNESDYALLDLPVFWLEDRVVSYVTPYPFYMRLKSGQLPITTPSRSASLSTEISSIFDPIDFPEPDVTPAAHSSTEFAAALDEDLKNCQTDRSDNSQIIGNSVKYPSDQPDVDAPSPLTEDRAVDVIASTLTQSLHPNVSIFSYRLLTITYMHRCPPAISDAYYRRTTRSL